MKNWLKKNILKFLKNVENMNLRFVNEYITQEIVIVLLNTHCDSMNNKCLSGRGCKGSGRSSDLEIVGSSLSQSTLDISV